jgi:hypothetical protein
MRHAYGTIKDGDKILIENVAIWYDVTIDPRSGLKGWYGSFTSQTEKYVEPGRPYRLILDDGRSGDILISNVEIRGSDCTVRFRGSGTLK